MPTRTGTEDLFPRGHARGQPKSRIKADEKKAEKKERDLEREREPERVRRGRLTIGATVLAVVTRCDERAIYFELPSGVRAGADPYEILDSDDATPGGNAIAAAIGEHELLQPDRDEETPLYKVLSVGQVVRASVIALHTNGTNHLQLSLKPALVNSGLSAPVLLLKGTPAYGVVKSVEDHGYVIDFGTVPTKGFLPFEEAPVTSTTKLTGKAAKADNTEIDDSSDDSDNESSSEDEDTSADDDMLMPGTPIEVVITQAARKGDNEEESSKKKKKKRARAVVSTVHVSAKPELVQKAETQLAEGLTFYSLRAGMRVGAKVLSVTRSQVVLTAFGLFNVIVDSIHAPRGADGNPNVKPGASVFIRLLSVDPGQKLIIASLLPKVVNHFQLRSVPNDFTVGTILKDLVIDHVESKYGLYLNNADKEGEEIGSAAKGSLRAPVFAHISRVSEKRVETLEKHFHKGMKIESARIVSLSKFDGTVNVDLRPSIIKRSVLDLREVRPGQCYNCKVVAQLSSGALSVAVDGDTHIRGIIPKMHIADAHISPKTLTRHPNLRSGGTVQCVALSVNVFRGMVYLSARRSLVSASYPLLTSFEEADKALREFRAMKEDDNGKSDKVPVFMGTVSQVMEKNMFVSFCNNTKGLLSFSELDLVDHSNKKNKKRKRNDRENARTQEEIGALYPLGQTIRVCVLNVDPNKHRLFLSMDLSGRKIFCEGKIPVGTVLDTDCLVLPAKKKTGISVDVKIGRSAIGRLHVTNTSRLSAKEKKTAPLGPLSVAIKKRFALPESGASISNLKVVGKLKAGKNSSGTLASVELAADSAKSTPFTAEYVPEVGSHLVGYMLPKSKVSNQSEDKSNLKFQITPHLQAICNRVDAITGADEPIFLSNKRSDFLPVLCMVKSVDMKASGGKGRPTVKVIASSNGANPEQFFIGTVQKIDKGAGLLVRLPWLARLNESKKSAVGHVSLPDIDDDFEEVSKKMSTFETGGFVRVRIVKCTPASEDKKSVIVLSMRNSDSALKSKDTLITKLDSSQLKVGQKVRGFVNSVTKFGAFVEIGRGIRALVRLADLSDEYVKEPPKQFPPGTLVAGKIAEIKGADSDDQSVTMSLRTKERPPKELKVNDVKEGQVVKGQVTRVERYGAIVKLSNGRHALLHKSEVSQDRKIDDVFDEWSIDQKITAVIIKVSKKTRKLGTKRCYFEAAGIDNDKIDEILDANNANEDEALSSKKRKLNAANYEQDTIAVESTFVKDENQTADEKLDTIMDGDNDEMSDENDVEETPSLATDMAESEHAPVLRIAHTFALEEDEETQPGSDLVDDGETGAAKVDATEKEGNEDDSLRKKKSSKEKRDKKRAKEAAEREIQAKEQTLASNSDSPESAEDFERMLLGEPNSSAIWIRYMAFRLSLLQIDKARAIAEQALDTIDMTKEVERVNIWMSYINLEANFGGGSMGESNPVMKAAAVFRIFDRAVKRVTDVVDFHLQVFASLKSNEPVIAEEVMKRAIRNFKSSKEVWIAAGSAKFEKGEASGARKVLDRALRSLDTRDHVAVILKLSQFEYRFGEIERARTVFESLIGNYPKRLDIWNVFLDMETALCRKADQDSEARSEALESTRTIFERCCALELSSKKMKSVFKKWLSFENVFGDKSSHKYVLTKAKQYVENKAGGLEGANEN